jgi:predicted GNAT family N-acyltransferase
VTLEVRQARPDELAACLALRHVVFVEEQRVPPELEQDGRDAEAAHFVAWRGDRLVGTARMRAVGDAAKAERVAVAREARGTGVGAALMACLERAAADRGSTTIVLHAQESAIPFYLRIGYTVEGPRFDDAGIPHRAMRRALG